MVSAVLWGIFLYDTVSLHSKLKPWWNGGAASGEGSCLCQGTWVTLHWLGKGAAWCGFVNNLAPAILLMCQRHSSTEVIPFGYFMHGVLFLKCQSVISRMDHPSMPPYQPIGGPLVRHRVRVWKCPGEFVLFICCCDSDSEQEWGPLEGAEPLQKTKDITDCRLCLRAASVPSFSLHLKCPRGTVAVRAVWTPIKVTTSRQWAEGCEARLGESKPDKICGFLCGSSWKKILFFAIQFHTYCVEKLHIFCDVLSPPMCLSGSPTSCNIFGNDHHCPGQDTVFTNARDMCWLCGDFLFWMCFSNENPQEFPSKEH